jgi:hypothetical protein
MPKIRNKNSGNINKSGTLSQTYKSYLRRTQEKESFFEKENIHNIFKEENNVQRYDDSDTIVFKSTNVNPTVFLRDDQINKNKILHTPNIYQEKDDVNSKRDVIVSKENFDNVIDYNFLESKKVSFNEQELNETKIVDNKENIVINFKRSSEHPIQLSYNFSGGTQNNISNNNFGVSFPSTNHSSLSFGMPICGNTVYLSHDEKEYVDYLSDVKFNHFNSLSDFLDAPIIFSGLTYSSDQSPKTLSNYNIPIEDFGFPYDSKFRPKDKHMIDMSEYIKKPFCLEKIVLNTSISNWSVSDSSNITDPCLNFINFFVISQRGSLSSNSLDNQRLIEHYGSSSIETTNIDNNYDDNQSKGRKFTRLKTSFDINSTKYTKEDGGMTDVTESSLSEFSHRELITNISVGNYSRKSSTFPYFSSESNLSSHCDLFNNMTSTNMLNSNNNAECIYEDKNINITSDIKSYKKQKILPRFSNFNIYPKKRNATRSNTERRSERSVEIENNTLENLENLYTDSHNKVIEVFNTTDDVKNNKENKYIVYPGDKLTFGISLTTNFSPSIATSSTQYTELSGRDIVHINNDISFTLVGHYLENDKEKTLYQKKTNESKNVKIVGAISSEVTDLLGNNSVFLSKGSYFDHLSTGIAGQTYQTGKEDNSHVNFNSRQTARTFSNFATLLDNDLSYKEKTGSTAKNIKHLYNLRHYGFYSDRIDSSYYPAYSSIEFKSREFPRVRKLFKKGLFTQKDTSKGDTINSYNKHVNCKLTNSELIFADPTMSIESLYE